MIENLVIGSGPSGYAGALAFCRRQERVCVLDVGYEPKREPTVEENLYTYCQNNDVFNLLVGEDYSGLGGRLEQSGSRPAKLNSPRMEFINRGVQKWQPVEGAGFKPVQSLAKGGLANAWGAGLYEFTERDLRGFPIRRSDLAPYYSFLTSHIGISGAHDDLQSEFGHTENLQESVKLSRKADCLLRRYEKRKAWMHRKGIRVGRPRLGVLTSPKDGRSACRYDNLEFWEPELQCIFNPRHAFERLQGDSNLDYRSAHLVQAYRYLVSENAYQVNGLRIDTGETFSIKCRRIFLAAGSINSAKIVLQSRHDYNSELPLLDNTAVQLPLVFPGFVGSQLETSCFGLTQLNVVCERGLDELPMQGSFLEITSPSRSEFFTNFPVSARSTLAFMRSLLPGMLVLQMFEPQCPGQGGRMSLKESGELKIVQERQAFSGAALRQLTGALLRLGILTHELLAVHVEHGQSLHYAGTLGMSYSPSGPYECDAMARLSGERAVYVLDGANFPELPAKNYSLTMMANAMRIVDSSLKGSQQ